MFKIWGGERFFHVLALDAVVTRPAARSLVDPWLHSHALGRSARLTYHRIYVSACIHQPPVALSLSQVRKSESESAGKAGKLRLGFSSSSLVPGASPNLLMVLCWGARRHTEAGRRCRLMTKSLHDELPSGAEAKATSEEREIPQFVGAHAPAAGKSGRALKEANEHARKFECC